MAETTATPVSATEDQSCSAPRPRASYVWGVGRRKSAVARVRVVPGTGKIEINGRSLNEYFTNERDRKSIFGPLEVTNTGGKMDVLVNASGGGPTGQTGAIVMGLSRALGKFDASLEGALSLLLTAGAPFVAGAAIRASRT